MDNPFASEWLDTLLADYKQAVIDADMAQEASIKHIMQDAGVSVDRLIALQEALAEGLGPEDREYLFSLLDANIYVPFVAKSKKKPKKKKDERDTADILSGGAAQNYWMAFGEETGTKVAHRTSPIQPITHPPSLACVFIEKSSLIHYSKPDKKQTLCKKKWTKSVDQALLDDPMYTVCTKCKQISSTA